MKFLETLAAFFYLQPSLIVSFVPLQIISLMVSLTTFKKLPFLKVFFYSIGATLFTTVFIFLFGFILVPLIYVRFFQLVEISFNASFFLFIASVFIYWVGINFYLHCILNLKNIIKCTAVSSAIAGLSVLFLYYLLWQK